MNFASNLNASFIKRMASIFDIIPKLIYFIFAAFCSGIDAMQYLIRKLAGLDKYYQASTGDAVSQKDPLTEFIYGILGIGDSAPAYKGLNTVFWSLAIFALIVLAVSTLVAIIKSHYGEDSESTNPWKYIYTAIKSVLVFAIIPVVTVIGMNLATFMLRTLDNITAGTSSEETVTGIYGANAKNAFVAHSMEGKDEKVYASYDVFGAAFPTNSATFGGMLFKASAFSCNRARSGNVHYSNYTVLTSNGVQIFASSDCSAYSSLQTDAEKSEYVAMQIDYAFTNCLEMKESWNYIETSNSIDSALDFNIIQIFNGKIDSFSKYNVGAVWLFYDLWSFNLIVGFGGGITMFGILISIIIGMMTRLIKGAALFLVYPPLLGLAPLDNFKAFKSWVTTFMQQILMAIGAIIGINLLLLILPYVQNIQFFGEGVIDYIINVVLLIAGLMMAKDFITLVAGFVGGADAASTGEGMKGSIAGGIKRGVGITGKLGATAVKGAVAFGGATVRTAAGGVKKWFYHSKAKRANKAAAGEYDKHPKKTKAYQKYQDSRAEAVKQAQERQNLRRQAEAARAAGAKVDKKTENAANKAYDKIIRNGGSIAEATKARDKILNMGMLKQMGKLKEYNERGDKYQKAKEAQAKADEKLNKYRAGAIATKYGLQRYRNHKGKEVFASDYKFWHAFAHGRQKKDKDGHLRYDDEGKPIMTGSALGDLAGIGKSMADGFLKAIKKDIGEGIGVDKMIGGATEIVKDMVTTKKTFGKQWGMAPGSKDEGDKLQAKISEDRKKEAGDQLAQMKDLNKTMGDVLAVTKETSKAMGNLAKAMQNNNNNNNNSNNNNNNSTP